MNSKEIELNSDSSKNETRKSNVTINNNYTSSVIAVIGNKEEGIEKAPTISIYMGNTNNPDTKIPLKKAETKEEKEIEENITKKLDMENINGDKEKIMDRLIQSVNMVKDVLQTNLKLRQQILDSNKQVDQLNAELFHVQGENEELKEKIQILAEVEQESPIKKPIPEPVKELGKIAKSMVGPNIKLSLSNTPGSAITPHDRISVVSELYKLKKDKSMLEQRLLNLERENINIRAKKSNNASFINPDAAGTDDFEPVRSVINGIEFFAKRPPLYRVKKMSSTKYSNNLARGSSQRESSDFNIFPKTSHSAQRGTRINQTQIWTDNFNPMTMTTHIVNRDEKTPFAVKNTEIFGNRTSKSSKNKDGFGRPGGFSVPRANRNSTGLKYYEDIPNNKSNKNCYIDDTNTRDNRYLMGNETSMSDYNSAQKIPPESQLKLMEKTHYAKPQRFHRPRFPSTRRANTKMFIMPPAPKKNIPLYFDNL